MADRRTQASESVSDRFTRLMNATTSPLGVLTDPSIVGLATAPLAVAVLAAARLEASPSVQTVLQIVALLPLLIAIVVALKLRRAREELVAWMATLPFALENMNAILNGLGDTLEVTFAEGAPARADLNLELDRVSPDCFVMEDEKPGVVAIRVGVVDDPRNPSVSNHRRFVRVRALVDGVLGPLAARFPVTEVRVK